MTVPDPNRLASGMDPRPRSSPVPPLGDTVPDPDRPGRPRPRPGEPVDPGEPDGRMHLVAAGREDRLRHVVDVGHGEFGDPTGLRARCGVPADHVVPGLRADQADCPACRSAPPVPS